MPSPCDHRTLQACTLASAKEIGRTFLRRAERSGGVALIRIPAPRRSGHRQPRAASATSTTPSSESSTESTTRSRGLASVFQCRHVTKRNSGCCGRADCSMAKPRLLRRRSRKLRKPNLTGNSTLERSKVMERCCSPKDKRASCKTLLRSPLRVIHLR